MSNSFKTGGPPLVSAVLALGLALAGCQSNTAPTTAAPTETPATESATAQLPSEPAAPAPAASGPKAPDFTLATVGGDTFHLQERLKKGPVLVSFFNPK